MDMRTRKIMSAALLFLGACSAVLGLWGLVMVIKMALLPSTDAMGHSRQYEEGWRLFFMLFIGLPSLAALLGGLAPWLIWWRNRRK
ncbi:MAG TPA: hypothetical protein PK836_02395 [Syntrophales bacterium]|nr:hypothetical protein [Syntrophales bacterium]HON99024.1 hypothetical protein [Syntrophales bacterium]HPC00512.1 hypothetical protein [Syntrophales bacterium]HPQ05595.1 hypothetical protein [Syntrophales bacterium]